ncbi:gamma-glutamyl-gamma-aminobutyrate hydrolase family protein [Meiothermus rufus]|uniref:gamma-glutamyl-gamma-aminobutyrate hydrolase family protein n=1 Tax=Meiothermus rufus TaxID=604332 RepID=UPI00048256FA|nr:gamma-glutamyl-gamma-aminobutyrate hydrolase family protein [Meiothermus rufus]
MRRFIGITVHTGLEPASSQALEVHYRLTAQYTRAVREAGGVPVLLPTHPEYAAEPWAVLEGLDGLLLSGGGGNRATFFAQGARPSLRETNPPRYDYEVALIQAARAAGLPLLGICRGFQTLVEAEGGPPVELLEPGTVQHDQTEAPHHPTHPLKWAAESWLGATLQYPTQVNSFHRQGVRQVPRGWQAVAWAVDGMVEAMESQEGLGVGVQFHPEWLLEQDLRFLALFRWLVRKGAT